MSIAGTSLTFTNGVTTLRLWNKRKEIPKGWRYFRGCPGPHAKWTIMIEQLPEKSITAAPYPLNQPAKGPTSLAGERRGVKAPCRSTPVRGG